jgi:hypothetical protein
MLAAVNFGFLTDLDTTRYCYLRLRRLKQALKDPKILDALADVLGVPDAGGKKMAAIERQIEHLRATKTSVWYGVAAPEVLAASIFGAEKLADGTVQTLFSHARRRTDLAAPLINWLAGSGLTPCTEVPVGKESIDIVGYRKGEFLSSGKILGIQVKNDLGGLHRALDQMTSFQAYTSSMYLACTPAMAAEYLASHAATPGVRHWDADALKTKLQKPGIGLLIIEGDAVAQALLPKEETPAKAKIDELVAALKAKIAAQG